MITDFTANELRKTAISVVGDVPWGTHFCYFYETKQDLLDTLLPYFKAGLENKEFCLWIISNSELLTLEEANKALRQALPDVERYFAKGSIEIVSHDRWFLNGGAFDRHRVAKGFKEKLDEALARGYAGMRVNGSPAWLQTKDAKDLREFEGELNRLFPNERIIASCTYPLAGISGDQIFDIVQAHQFAIARRQGEWEVIETPELKQAKAEVKRLNDELGKKVEARTTELRKVNRELEKANHQLRILSGRLFHIQEEERRHLARELHDQIGQALTAAKINTDMLRSTAPSNLASRLNENAAILERLLQQTRQISLDLRPPLLDDLGLVPALRWYVNQQAERAGLEAKFSADPLADDVAPPIQIACFRLAQEVITNVVRHAHAKTLTVELHRADSFLHLIVRDDGQGFDVAAARARAEQGASFGLLGIKERATLAGGSARINSSIGEGATVEILLPMSTVKGAVPA